MNHERSLTPIRTLMLGAINGLIVGLALEKARITYLNYQMGRAAREYADSDWAVDFIAARWKPLIPLVCIGVFALVGYLVYQYFMNRPQLLLMFWFGLGAIGLGFGYFMSTSNPNVLSFLWLFGLVAVSYAVHRLWKSRPDSLVLVWLVIGISSVVVVAVAVQLVGLFFYWPELRSPLLWLLCLLGVVAFNGVFGVVVQVSIDRFDGKKLKQESA